MRLARMPTEPESTLLSAHTGAGVEPVVASPFTMVGEAADTCVDGVCAIPDAVESTSRTTNPATS